MIPRPLLSPIAAALPAAGLLAVCLLAACGGPVPTNDVAMAPPVPPGVPEAPVEARPDAAQIDRLEARLAADRCIGAMERWERRYSFGLDTNAGGLDPNRIWFMLYEAGHGDFRASRRVMTPAELGNPTENRRYRFASGLYDLRDGSLIVEVCGDHME